MTLGDSLRHAARKQNSAGAWRAKVELRERALDFIGISKARVFDAFAGAGELYRAVWANAVHYEGCDKTLYLDERTMFCADNRRVLRCIDLSSFNVFDLDAHGSPWEQAAIVAARRAVAPGEHLAMILTLGEGLNLKMGMMPMALRRLAGFQQGVPGALRDGEIADRAIRGLARRMTCEIVHRWQAESRRGSRMRYVALALRGTTAP